MRDRLMTLVSAALAAWISIQESLRSPLLFLKNARGYRPEKFYMRGPGPKWHEKHAHLY
jgi:hypothetical protein